MFIVILRRYGSVASKASWKTLLSFPQTCFHLWILASLFINSLDGLSSMISTFRVRFVANQYHPFEAISTVLTFFQGVKAIVSNVKGSNCVFSIENALIRF